jgi:hypothetical protein
VPARQVHNDQLIDAQPPGKAFVSVRGAARLAGARACHDRLTGRDVTHHAATTPPWVSWVTAWSASSPPGATCNETTASAHHHQHDPQAAA